MLDVLNKIALVEMSGKTPLIVLSKGFAKETEIKNNMFGIVNKPEGYICKYLGVECIISDTQKEDCKVYEEV